MNNNLVQNLTALRNLPASWTVFPFQDIVKDFSAGNKKTLKSDFLDEGEFVIVDQGQDTIAGYTNNKNNLVKSTPPYIVFGDHTRIFKYIDVPFAMGADGTKVLKSKDKNILNERYLYYFFLTLNIPNTGYNRHFKYLKSSKIPLPPLAVQQNISSLLDAADSLRQKDQQLIEKYTALSQSLFLDMFGDPVSNPMGWGKVKLEELAKISSGSTPSREMSEYYQGNIPWVKTGEVDNTKIITTAECISEQAIKDSSCRIYPIGSLIIAMYGQGKTRGKVGRLGIDAATNQACAVIPPSEKMNYDYLLMLLKLSYEDLRRLGRGGNQPNLNSGLIKLYCIISPPITLQNQFEERIQAIEAQKQQAEASLQKSNHLFNSLLQRAFKAELNG